MKKPSRRDFLKNSTLAGLGLSVAGTFTGCATNHNASKRTPASSTTISGDITETRPRPAGQKPVNQLTTTPLERVRVAYIGCGGRGNSLIKDVLAIEFTDITAVCDLRSERAESAADRIEKARGKRPATFGGDEHIWEKLCE